MSFLTTKLSELIVDGGIVELEVASKTEALRVMSERMGQSDKISNTAALYRALVNREQQASTGVGMGIAIPHVKIPEVADYAAAVGRSRSGIPFDALDNKPVHLIFMIGASDRHTREFVRILAQVTHLLKSADVREALLAADIPDQFMNIIREHEH